jgi:acyl carrier protein
MDVLQEIIFPAVEEAKRSIASAAVLEAAPESKLFGNGGLDSLGLVRFIVMVEEKIEARTNIELTLASEKAMSRGSSPFRTLQTLADYIGECLLEEGFRG